MTPKQREELKESIRPIIEDAMGINTDIVYPGDMSAEYAEKILQEVEKDFQIVEVKKWAHYAGDI